MTEQTPAAIDAVTQIVTVRDDGSEAVAYLAMSPQQIVDVLKYLDPGDLQDVIKGLTDAFNEQWNVPTPKDPPDAPYAGGLYEE